MLNYALIVAGGTGRRMNAGSPKQFLNIHGRPVLFYSLEVFFAFDPDINILLVLPENRIEQWESLCNLHRFDLQHTIVTGGKSRMNSVMNGLDHLSGNGYVAIHDGVRPCLTQSLINRCFVSARNYGSGVPCIPVYDTIRKKDNEVSITIRRDELLSVQTPQVFDLALIKEAYDHVDKSLALTDDASVAESFGHEIQIVEGEKRNIKITTPDDLLIAQTFLSDK